MDRLQGVDAGRANERITVGELPGFDAARYLDSDDAIAKYLTAVNEQNDPALLAAALTEIASAAGLTREALYKALRRDAQPRFDIISRVCAAQGVRLVGPAGGTVDCRARHAAGGQRRAPA